MFEEFGNQIRDMKGKWQKHFAFIPVEINGTKYWFKTVYRRQNYVNGMSWGWEYGTILDVIKLLEEKDSGGNDGGG